MRILHVVTRLGLGGAERVAETLAIGLADGGHAVAVLAIAPTRDPGIAADMRRNLASHEVHVIDRARAGSAKVALAEGAWQLARALHGWRPDVVHLHTEIPEAAWATASVVSRPVHRTPVVRTVHNTRLWGGWGRLGRVAERRLVGAPAAAVSHAAGEALQAWRATCGLPPVEPVIIDNGVELIGLPLGPRALGPRPLLCFAGRFEEQKGIDILIDSLDLLSSPGATFQVALHGAGRLAPLVEGAASRRPDRVTSGPPLVGLRSLLASFDAILMPSRFEGMPLLAVEAMCAGIPMLATKAPGLAEVLPEWYPGQCPPGDPAAFAAVIDSYLRDPAGWRDEALRAQPGARARFAVERMLQAYSGLYQKALSA